MDKKFIYGIFVFLLVVILLGALYLFHYRIKSLESSKLQLQKHVLYHQQIIERYNQLLGANNNIAEVRNNSRSQPPLPRPPMHVQVEEPDSQIQQPQPQQAQNPLGGLNVGNILPMMSSIMSIMNPEETNTNVVDNVNEDDAERESKKELEEELENELKELKDSIQEDSEGRVDDVKVEPKSQLREVASVSSEKSVASLESEDNESVQSTRSI